MSAPSAPQIEVEGADGWKFRGHAKCDWLADLALGENRKQAKEDLARMGANAAEKVTPGLSPLLDGWAAAVGDAFSDEGLRGKLTVDLRAKLQDPLMERHGVCHGLDGLHAARGDEPGWLSWTLNGKSCRKTWDELEAMFAWLSKVPHAMQILSATGSAPFS